MGYPNIYCVLTYSDPAAAIDWLCKAFGFKEHFVARGEEGSIKHAELSHGRGILMLGGSNPALGLKSPKEEPAAARATYVSVEDADAHHDRAKAAGAEITMALRDTDYGSRDYGAKDPEGHSWYYGTYAPEPEKGA